MSFTQLFDKFDLVSQHLRQGLKSLSSLSSFFKGYKRSLESFSASLQKQTAAFQLDLPIESGVDTLSTAMSAIPLTFQQVAAHYVAGCQSLQLEVIEPLDLFFEHFTTTNGALISTGAIAFNGVLKAREVLEKRKSRYLDACSSREKADQGVVVSSGERLEKAKKTYETASNAANQAAEQYTSSVSDYNSQLSEYERKCPDVLESLQQSEESRIHFLKYTLEKFVRVQQKVAVAVGAEMEDLAAIVGNVNSPIDIRVFVDGQKGVSPGLVKEDFLPYETLRSEESPDSPPPSSLSTVLQTLLFSDGSPGSTDDRLESGDTLVSPDSRFLPLIEALKTSEGRSDFLTSLETRRTTGLLSASSLTLLSDLFTVLLTEIQMTNDRDASTFYRVTALTQAFWSESAGKRKYLHSLLAQHRIWSDVGRWMQTIEWAVATRVAVEKQTLQRLKRRRRGSGLFHTLKSFATNLPTLFQREQSDEKAEKSSAFLVLSQFGFLMTSLGLSVEVATDTILQCCYRLRLDGERTVVLLAELQANQKHIARKRTVGAVQRSLKRREKERTLYGDWLPVALSALYLPASDYLSIILTRKMWSAPLSRMLLQAKMTRASATELQLMRSAAWKFLLTAYAKSVEYSALLWKVDHGEALSKEMEEMIELDVQRSYISHPMISSAALSNLLRTYAYYNPDIGYCQGMNYIVGHLYIQLQDEGETFKCLVGLIEQFNMHSLLVRQLPRLKLCFYQMDRLVGMLLPELHEVFREEMVTSSHFAAPWFLTLFATVYQGGNKHMDVLFRLWDLFLFVRPKQKGWKVIFKAGIAILQTLQSELITKKFEDIMGVLTALQVNSAAIYEDSFISTVLAVKVTTSQLRDLESEYEHIKLRASCPPPLPTSP